MASQGAENAGDQEVAPTVAGPAVTHFSLDRTRDLLHHVARTTSWRGITTAQIVYAVQDWRDAIEDLRDWPDFLPAPTPPEIPDSRAYRQLLACYYESLVRGAVTELQRRRRLAAAPVRATDPELVQAVKDRAPVQDVIEWYFPVTYHGRSQWKFRCGKHGNGEDREPSGVIYVAEGRWHCYGCDHGGDALDAVVFYQGLSFREALRKLAAYVGLDLKPVLPAPGLRVKGGACL